MMNKKSSIQQECLDSVLPLKLSGAMLGTGSGKTLLGLKHMAHRYNDTALFLVVAPTLSIHNEWQMQAVEHGYEWLLPHITFTTYISLAKQETYYDQVYADECHHFKLKHVAWLTYYNGKVFGMTGTYPTSKFSESYKVCSTYCPLSYTYTIEDGIDDGMLNDYKIYIHLLELEGHHKNYKPNYGGLTTEKDDYAMHNRKVNYAKPQRIAMARIHRMKAIQSYNTKVTYAKKLLAQQTTKTLVFTDYTKQADLLCQHSYHSKNKNSQKNLDMFCKDELLSLSSVQQIAEGANIPNLKTGIILHAYANEKKLAQKIGRLLRLNPEDKSKQHVLCYNNTVDLDWCKKALKSFDKNKIFKYNVNTNTT